METKDIQVKLLLVEPDYYREKTTKNHLEEYGYEVIHCTNAELAAACFKRYLFDLCLIKTTFSQINGSTLITKIRNMNSTIPIFLLVEKQADTDRIDCYKAGADVCLTEPFCLEELLLRIAVWLRRSKKIGSGFTAQYRFEKNTIFDYNEHLLMQGPIRKNLTDRTRNLMKFFMEHPNEPLSKEQIATEVWGKYNYLISRNMDVYITKIRHYFEDYPSVNLKTLNRFGFNFLVSDMAVYINGKLVKKITQNKIRVCPRHYGYRKKITR